MMPGEEENKGGISQNTQHPGLSLCKHIKTYSSSLVQASSKVTTLALASDSAVRGKCQGKSKNRGISQHFSYRPGPDKIQKEQYILKGHGSHANYVFWVKVSQTRSCVNWIVSFSELSGPDLTWLGTAVFYLDLKQTTCKKKNHF